MADEPPPTTDAELTDQERQYGLLLSEHLALKAEIAALRRFRDAVDAASVAYHASAAGGGAPTLPPVFLRLERAVALALTALQDELDARDGAREVR